jgi:uncharacterized damage-inducible protein DinB
MISDAPVSAAIDANIAVLRQGMALVLLLGEARYTRKLRACYDASIGGHLRHVIEHYQGFLAGLEADPIDYENRPRNRTIEEDPDHALARMAELVRSLTDLAPSVSNRTLDVASETAPGMTSPSSLLRELEFLLSHTIHHYALIATMARLQGVEPEPTFGIAPSTLKYQHEQTACAR